jgi:hypothetical protein
LRGIVTRPPFAGNTAGDQNGRRKQMKIHTDRLERRDLFATVPAGCWLEAVERGSRSRAHAFDVRLSADHGADAHGLARVYAQNSGRHGADQGPDRAATWIEYGDWMVELFKRDPSARIGMYDSPADFVRMTTDYAPHRPKRENAPAHAKRWAAELRPYVDDADAGEREHDQAVRGMLRRS